MLTPNSRAARGRLLSAGLIGAMALCGVSVMEPVAAQTKKPTPTPPKPRTSSKANTKAGTQPILPGVSPKMPVAAQNSLRKILQEQLDARDEARTTTAKATAELLRRSKAVTGDEQAACLIWVGKHQVDAQRWTDAEKTFLRVRDEHPESVWTVEASLFLFDLALEHQLDPQRGTDHLQPALEWLKTVSAPVTRTVPLVSTLAMTEFSANGTLPVQSIGPSLASTIKDEDGKAASADDNTASVTATGASTDSFTPREAHQIAADVRLRTGLLAWLRDDVSAAKAEFQHALVLHESEATPLTVLAHKLRLSQRVATVPDPVKNGNADCAQLIRLALVLTEAPQTYRAHRLWNAIAKRSAEQQTLPQKSFVLFHRAQTRFRFQNPLERDAAAILADYQACVKAYPLADWADDALFLAGNVEFNLNRNTDRAVEHWRQVLSRQPASEHQQRAAYYIGVALETAKKWDEAKLAYDDAKSRFPESQFNPLIDKHLKKVTSELSRPKPKPSG